MAAQFSYFTTSDDLREIVKDGYRDYLIWLTFLNVVHHYAMDEACFITLNTRDFSDPIDKKELHPQLKRDLEDKGISLTRVSYFTSLKEFVEARVKPSLQIIELHEKLIEQLKADRSGFMYPLEENLAQKITGLELSGFDIVLEEGENPSIQENIELGGQNMSSYIEVKNVSKSFSGRAILQNISLPVEQGTTVGLVGANGSGKSVLFKIICGFEKPDQGSVYVRGNQLGKNGCDFPESLGVFINSPGFIGIYNGFQNLKFLADIQGKIGEKEIRQAMSKVGLDPDNKTKVDNYSLGMKQKLGLAQAIMEGQDILILDEPFNALDYKTYEDVKAIIRMLKAEGKTIFLTSHHYKDIEQLCDQVYSIEDCQLLPITEEIAARYREME